MTNPSADSDSDPLASTLSDFHTQSDHPDWVGQNRVRE